MLKNVNPQVKCQTLGADFTIDGFQAGKRKGSSNMNVTENRAKNPYNITKNASEIATLSPLQQHGLKNMFIHKDMISAESKNCANIPTKNETVATKKVNNSTLNNTNNIIGGQSRFSGDVPCNSNVYLPDFCTENSNVEPNINHKFYGCKRREHPSHCCESFGLPDDPIFSNSPLFFDRIQKCPLDIDTADPWDLCVVNLEHIDQPWLIENPEVITPYWDVESLFPFEVEDIRQKIDPDDKTESTSPKTSWHNESFVSNEFIDNLVLNKGQDLDNVFTSTPLKNRNDNPCGSVSVVSTINITNNEGNGVDISVFKDQVIKALEKAIKKKNAMTNIDMKIQIVADISTSPETSLQKSSVDLRINESIETESCQSFSSSKENYFIGNRKYSANKPNKLDTESVTSTEFNRDSQESKETIFTGQQEEHPNKKGYCDVHRSSPKKECKKRKKKCTLPTIHKSLRSLYVSKEINNEGQSSGACTRSSQSINNFEITKKKISSKRPLSQEKIPEKRILRSNLRDFDDLGKSSLKPVEKIITLKSSKRSTKILSQPINLNQVNNIESKTLQLKEKNNGSSSIDSQDLGDNGLNDIPDTGNKDESIMRNKPLRKYLNHKVAVSRNYRKRQIICRNSKSNILRSTQNKKNHNIVHNPPSDLMIYKCGDELKEQKTVCDSLQNHDIKETCAITILPTNKKKKHFKKIDQGHVLAQRLISQPVGTSKIGKHLTRKSPRNQSSKSIYDDTHSSKSINRSILEKSVEEGIVQKKRNLVDEMHNNHCQLSVSEEVSAEFKIKSPLYAVKRKSSGNNSTSSLFGRVLRSSNQGLKVNSDNTKHARRRTLSSSLSEMKTNETPNSTPHRERSVSANFDSKRNLRSSQPIEEKLSGKLCSPEYHIIQNIKSDNTSQKSPKISFNFNNSVCDSPKNMKINPHFKGILKNIYNGDLCLSNKSMNQEKVATLTQMDCEDTFDDLPKLTRQDSPEEDDKFPENKCLKDNGITSQIKVVINPLLIKCANEDMVGEECPLLSFVTPVPSKSVWRSNTCKINNRASHQRNNSIIFKNSSMRKIALIKEIKDENIIYKLGDFVWAQVAKFPYWPAVICNDPLTEIFYNEVQVKKKPHQIYHIRFFGDAGRRAWVKRKQLMLYCNKQDLEKIAFRLKSESRNHNAIKPYIITGAQRTVDKWNKGIEEIENLKCKPYEEVLKYLIKCYETYINERKNRRKTNMIDASSESESELAEINENPRRKRFKATHEMQVNTSQNSHSLGFDEINISVRTKDNGIKIIDMSSDNKPKMDLATENSDVHSDKKFKKNPKGSRIMERSRKSEDKSRRSCPPLKIDNKKYLLDNETKVEPRRSRRSFKTVNKFDMENLQPKNLDTCTLETDIELKKNVPINSLDFAVMVTPQKEDSSNTSMAVSTEKNLENIDGVETEHDLNKKENDEASEVGSKISSESSTISNMCSFEYQVELHKKNSLFNGLRNIKVCDYCFKQGDLYKCKGRCGGFFHLECAAKVILPRDQRRFKKGGSSPSKAKTRNSTNLNPQLRRSEDCCKTRSQSQCQIVTIKSRHVIDAPKKDNFPANFHEMSIAEQIDYGMKEMMRKFENRTVYNDLTDSSSEEGSSNYSNNRHGTVIDSPASSTTVQSEKSTTKCSDIEEIAEEEKSSDDLEVSMISESVPSNSIKHVTADSILITEVDAAINVANFKCTFCLMEKDPPCFSCGLEVSRRGDNCRQKCSQFRCGRYFHPHCLKIWPQTQWSIGKWSKNQPEDSFTCPAHKCHTCFSEELGSTAACRLPGDKLARCLLCPAAFHTTTFCVPAGTEILGGSQIICPRHRSRPIQPINTVWCFICSEGGNLICCDTCPTSVHPECQPINYTDDDKYICEDCESGRFPLYDEVVWVKLGQYRWWPAIVLFPNEVPENVRALRHQRGDFAVRFYGTNDHYWVNKARSFLFQEGDKGGSPGEANRSKNKVYETFGKAIEDAAHAYKLKKEFKLRREAECINSLKPPPYTRINRNKPVGNVKSMELDLSNATACECDPEKPHPCGPSSNCINRLLMTECDPDVCPAGIRCRNQAFQKREYPPMVPYKTQGRGWGLKSLAPIKMGQFVIEYVGELIDSEEYQRRIRKMHEKKEENYYFMTVDSDRMIDAGPKGNLSRFMNHSCNPNCFTQKWTVKGDTVVGLFANCDIDTGTELTFNYNLEVVGQEKKICKCGATNCSGYIGVKAKLEKPEKNQTESVSTHAEQRKSRKSTKKRTVTPLLIPPCFMCGRKKSDITCNNKFCNKGYHLRCLNIEEMPEVSKYACPRHSCNMCSNRTIRCCVKCINSFCPSHSEGNVRHDKFLGFVCRLHDPVISSVEGSSELEKETIQSKSGRKKRTDKMVNLDKVRWKEIKPVKPLMEINKVKHETSIKSLSLKTIGKHFNGRNVAKLSLPLSVDKKEARRAQWRLSQAKYRLKRRAERLEASQMSHIENEVMRNNNHVGIVSKNNVTSFYNLISLTQQASTKINCMAQMTTEATRVAPSENNPDIYEVAEITASALTETSYTEAYKFSKRRPPKPELTDESVVSSTTSDEGSISKAVDSKISRPAEPDQAFDTDKLDHVSSSPIKQMQQNSCASEDELSLSTRLKKKRIRKSKILA